MKTYIRLEVSSNGRGDEVRSKINALIKSGKIDADTRLFIARNQYITMEILAEVNHFCTFEEDSDFADNNLVLIPRKWVVENATEYGQI